MLNLGLAGGRDGEINCKAKFIFYVLICKYLSEESLCGWFVCSVASLDFQPISIKYKLLIRMFGPFD